MTPLLIAHGIAVAGRLHPTDLSVPPQSLVALIGPNGSGKTSLLRALAGIEIDRGTVAIASETLSTALPARRRKLLSYLPASRDLVWPIRVRDVVALGLPAPDPQRVEELLDLLELGALADRQSNLLSTGERSRVLLARALAAKPRLLLLDEPLSNLDPYWVLNILKLLRDTVQASDCSALVSLHDIDRVAAFDRVLLIDDGRISADLAPREMLGAKELEDAFRIEKAGAGWTIRTAEDRRSSP